MVSKRFIKFTLFLFTFIAITALAEEPIRWPSTFNPNPVAGRLYVQPLSNFDTDILLPLQMEYSFSGIAEYNPNFHAEADDEAALFLNINMHKLTFSKGWDHLPYPFEVESTFRLYFDYQQTLLSEFLLVFHEAIDSPKEIPPAGLPYQGTIGSHQTKIIGEPGELYLATKDLHLKMQLPSLHSDWTPLFVKTTFRFPLTSQPFNTLGIGISLSSAYLIEPHMKLLTAGSLSYQALHKEDFNAPNIKVRSLVYDLYTCFFHDPGLAQNFTYNIGMRYSSLRVTYPDHDRSALPPFMLHGSLNYHMDLFHLFFEFNEDFIRTQSALEPDITLTVGARKELF